MGGREPNSLSYKSQTSLFRSAFFCCPPVHQQSRTCVTLWSVVRTQAPYILQYHGTSVVECSFDALTCPAPCLFLFHCTRMAFLHYRVATIITIPFGILRYIRLTCHLTVAAPASEKSCIKNDIECGSDGARGCVAVAKLHP